MVNTSNVIPFKHKGNPKRFRKNARVFNNEDVKRKRRHMKSVAKLRQRKKNINMDHIKCIWRNELRIPSVARNNRQRKALIGLKLYNEPGCRGNATPNKKRFR